MSTYRDLIEGAMRLLNVVSEAESPTAYQAQTALDCLNGLIDQWNANQAVIYTQDFHLVSPTNGVFTIGPGADIDIPSRPAELDSVFCRMNASSANPIDIPMVVLNASEYSDVRSKAVTSAYPRYIYMNGDWPVGTAYLWPVADGDYQVSVLVNHTLSSTVSLDDTCNLPPAYRQALRYELACVLAPEYGKEASASVQTQAYKAKNLISIQNTDIDRLDYDIRGTSGGRYWIVSDSKI